MVIVRRKFIAFHLKKGIVYFTSFQSFARITYAGHGNDFLPSKLRSRTNMTNVLVQTGKYQRKNYDVNKCIEDKR